MQSWGWTLLGILLLLLFLLALRFRHELRLARLRIRLLEAVHADILEAVGELNRASRESATRVAESLDLTLRRFAPATDLVMIFEAAGEESRVCYARGERALHFEGLSVPRTGETLVALALVAGHHLILPRAAQGLVPTDRAALAVPLGSADAVVYLSSARAMDFSSQHIVRFIEQAATPLALAKERENDRALATYDGLTGLLTPRAFRARLAEEVRAATMLADVTLALWFIDTDHFKRINDTLGHAAGDIVLQKMGQLLRSHSDINMDVAARNGGDEFCAILRHATKSGAIIRAQALCEAVSATNFGVGVPMSASIGVVAYPDDARSSNELLELADAAMYHSKRAGRNCVSFSNGHNSFLVLNREASTAS